MNPSKRMRTQMGVASALVVALVGAGLVYVATRADGEIVRKADLHDGGVWVTNGDQSRFGRLNKAAGQLDAGVATEVAPNSGIDVLQDGAAVVGLLKASNQAIPIASTAATFNDSGAVVVPAPAKGTGNQIFLQPTIDLRGGTVAAIEPDSGKIRAQRVDPRTGVDTLSALAPTAKPLATVGPKTGSAAVIAVGVDGTVYAASAASGEVVTVPVDPGGTGFGEPVVKKLDLTSKAVNLTAVGGTWVLFDPMTSKLYSPTLDQPVEVQGVKDQDPGKPAYAALQQPSDATETVMVAGPRGMVPVSLTKAQPDNAGVTIGSEITDKDKSLLVTAPVRLGECAHAAWSGAARVYYGRNCGQREAQPAVDLGPMGKGTRTDGVRLRTNRGLLVLNDLDSGAAWDLDSKPLKIDNWESVIPPPVTDNKNTKKDQNLEDDLRDKTPPQAQPDNLKVRPGRTSSLHVLDNDTDASGSILGIYPGDITGLDAPDVQLSVSADGQTVQCTVPENPAQREFHFDYTVNNGTNAPNAKSTAKVTVTVVDETVNTPPKLRPGAKLAEASYPVNANRPVTVAVIADWRDEENDPLTIEATTPGVGVDPAGGLKVVGAAQPGPMEVAYAIADGRGAKTPAKVAVTVLGPADKAVPPRTQPDVIRAVVGKPVDIKPLGNDVPGADPAEPDALMRLASDVRGQGTFTATTDKDTGVVTFTGQAPGTSIVTYAAQVGSATNVGRIRVDVLAPPEGSVPPVAMPDSGVLRGQAPVLVDVLANDSSPRSDVLVVQRATSSTPWLEASVVQGRWVRLRANAPLVDTKERRAQVNYTVSDGTASAVGTVSVTQKGSDSTVLPTLKDDTAVVRIGDAVTIPVLDNDSMSDGIPLKLDPAGVKIVAGKGQAFASGSVVRFVPDAAPITTDQVVVVEYTAYPERIPDRAATARVEVTVTPQPGEANPNQPPNAKSFSASVTAGDTLNITVPTSGVDPDGDLVFVSGIVGAEGQAVDLRLGRVLGFGAATIKYQAYPRSSGTEIIRYQVNDRFGGKSEGVIRVGVVQPGDPQPPIAVEDDIVAAPGRTVHADLLINDLISAGDQVTFEDFTKLNDAKTLQEFTRQDNDTFDVVAPEEGPAKVLQYGITNGLFEPSRSTLTVRGQKDFNNAPIAVDDVAKPKQGEPDVVVDVLVNDRDLDGTNEELEVVSATGQGVTVEPNKRQVRITMLGYPRVVPYVIKDAHGAQAMALIYVPTGDNGAPALIQGKTIQMDQDSTTSIQLGDYVMSPRGRKVTIVSPDTLSTSPSGNLQQKATGPVDITLTSTNGYVGPGALMLAVTDATGVDDTTAMTAYVSIPVQIGPKVPVLRCPDYEVTVQADGPERILDIPRLCHAWVPDDLEPSRVEYTAEWAKEASGVSLKRQGESQREVVLKADKKAPNGDGALTIGVKGSTETSQIRVKVVGGVTAPPATLRPALIEGLPAGQSKSIDLRPYLSTSLPEATCTITESTLRDGSGLTGSQQGCVFTAAAGQDARGRATFIVKVTDGPDRPVVFGEVTVTIQGRPDAPTGVNAVPDRASGGQARVSFQPPVYNGGLPVQAYEIKVSDGRTVSCAGSPCTVTGLRNGQPYTFQVRAKTAVGWSDWSVASNQAIPDKLPPGVGITATVPGDRTMAVTWVAPVGDFSEIVRYEVQYLNVGATGGGGIAPVAAPTMTATIGGLVNNDLYSYRVRAVNGLGAGPWGPAVQKQSVGVPKAPAAPQTSAAAPTPGTSTSQVNITWGTTDPNGPPIAHYTVFRQQVGGGWTPIGTVSGSAARTSRDTVPYDGRCYLYAVSATNGGGKESLKSAPSAKYCADGYPPQQNPPSVSTVRADKSIDVVVNLATPNAAGGFKDVAYETTTGAHGRFACSGGTCKVTIPNQSIDVQQMRISACNTAGFCSPMSANGNQYQPYGPTRVPGNLRMTGVSGGGGNFQVNFAWDHPGPNGRHVSDFHIRGSGVDRVVSNTTTSWSIPVGWGGSAELSVATIADVTGESGFAGPVSGRAPDQPPPPPPVVEVWRGEPTKVDTCQSSPCGRIGVTLSGFPSADASCFFDSSDGNGSWTNPVTIPVGSPYPTSKVFGYPGGWVKVTCTGGGKSGSKTYIWPN